MTTELLDQILERLGSADPGKRQAPPAVIVN
jgi:hypothetical protein